MTPFGRMQLTLIDYPNGRFGFVGSVPVDLAVDANGKNRVWDNADLARQEAAALGYQFVECISLKARGR